MLHLLLHANYHLLTFVLYALTPAAAASADSDSKQAAGAEQGERRRRALIKEIWQNDINDMDVKLLSTLNTCGTLRARAKMKQQMLNDGMKGLEALKKELEEGTQHCELTTFMELFRKVNVTHPLKWSHSGTNGRKASHGYRLHVQCYNCSKTKVRHHHGDFVMLFVAASIFIWFSHEAHPPDSPSLGTSWQSLPSSFSPKS